MTHMVVMAGLEPAIDCVWSSCISHYATLPYRNTLDIGDRSLTDEPEFSQICFYMVGRVGFEPTTLGLKVRYSSQLSYRPMSGPPLWNRTTSWTLSRLIGYKPTCSPWANGGIIFGTDDKNWTCDTLFFRQVLYQLSYIGIYGVPGSNRTINL